MNAVFSPRPLSFLLLIIVFLTASTVLAQPAGLSGATVHPYFTFPVESDAALVSFDWDASDTLHYTVGDPSFNFKQEVYKTATPDDIQVYSAMDVFVGSRLTCIGDYMYFNDGADFMRSAFNYFFYPAATADTPASLLAHPYGANLWGLATRNAGEFFASGSEVDWGPAALFYNTLDGTGNFDGVLTKFGDIGESPGPLTFDAAGNLYYAPGYVGSGTANIYRWDAAAVAAALADPGSASLLGTGNEWAVIPTPYNGATGMATDSAGNLYVSATAYGEPSQLLYYDGATAAMFPVVEYANRLETVRYKDASIYFSGADGVFEFPLPQALITTVSTEIPVSAGETAVFSIQAIGTVGAVSYQWYQVTQDKASVPVGADMPSYSMTAQETDDGAEFYCVVTDATGSVESPHFTLTLEPPVPASTLATLVVMFTALVLSGLWYAGKRPATHAPRL